MKYKLSGEVRISVMTQVEAESREEAIEKAYEYDLQFKSWPSDEDYDETWIASDLDGEVLDVTSID